MLANSNIMDIIEELCENKIFELLKNLNYFNLKQFRITEMK